jgi:hypothetical protein
LVEAIQKIYLGVGRVITSDEAREIINSEFGAGLTVPGPDELGPSVPTPEPGAEVPPSSPDEAAAMLSRRAGLLAKVNGGANGHAHQ